MAEELTKALFESHKGRMFAVGNGSHLGLYLKLAEVIDAPDRFCRDSRGNLRMESFRVIFEGLVEADLPQEVYHLESAEGAVMDLLLVPIMTGRSDVRDYEAVINRLLT